MAIVMKFISTRSFVELEIALFKNSATGFLKSAIRDEFFSLVYFFTGGKNMLGPPCDVSLI